MTSAPVSRCQAGSVQPTELHRQAASMFLCWPTNAIDLAQKDADLPELIDKLALFIATWEAKGLAAAPQPVGNPLVPFDRAAAIKLIRLAKIHIDEAWEGATAWIDASEAERLIDAILSLPPSELPRQPTKHSEGWRTDFENAPSPCIGWCTPPAGDVVWQIWHDPYRKGEWSAHGCAQTVKAWQPLPTILPQPQASVSTPVGPKP